MKRTPEGQRLMDLYWQHTLEVVRLLLANPLFREQVAGVVATFQPGVAALLSGNGQSYPITQSMIDQLNVLWSALIEKASPALKTALEQERARFNNFQEFVNKDFSQWAGLLEIPAPTQPWIFISSATREGGRITVECNDIPGTDLTLWRSRNLSSWEQVLNPEVSRSIHTIRFIDPAPPRPAASSTKSDAREVRCQAPRAKPEVPRLERGIPWRNSWEIPNTADSMEEVGR